MGTIKRDTQIRAIKNAKNKAYEITGARPPAHLTPQGLGHEFRLARPRRASDTSSDSPDPVGPRTRVPTRPTPQGLGHEFRLARPRRASDASSDSPDPSGSRTQVPSRPTPSGLGRRIPIHQVNKTSTIRRPCPRSDKRDDSHTIAGQGADCSNHPGHCSLTSFTV